MAPLVHPNISHCSVHTYLPLKFTIALSNKLPLILRNNLLSSVNTFTNNTPKHSKNECTCSLPPCITLQNTISLSTENLPFPQMLSYSIFKSLLRYNHMFLYCKAMAMLTVLERREYIKLYIVFWCCGRDTNFILLTTYWMNERLDLEVSF